MRSRKATLAFCVRSSCPIWKMPVPSSAMAAKIASTSFQAAWRLATGEPSGVMCVWVREVETPTAPARSASWMSRVMARISSSVASSVSARRPMTYMRSAECPTYIAWLRAFGRRSTAARYSGNVSQVQSMPAAMAAAGMSST